MKKIWTHLFVPGSRIFFPSPFSLEGNLFVFIFVPSSRSISIHRMKEILPVWRLVVQIRQSLKVHKCFKCDRIVKYFSSLDAPSGLFWCFCFCFAMIYYLSKFTRQLFYLPIFYLPIILFANYFIFHRHYGNNTTSHPIDGILVWYWCVIF